MKIGWNTWGEPYWGYSYNEDCDYEHEICFYRLYICWEDKKAKQKKSGPGFTLERFRRF